MPKSALLFVEGYTEEVFFKQLKTEFFGPSRVNIINLEGNWNIDQKILDKASIKIEANPHIDITCFVSIDRESRNERAPIHMDVIQKELAQFPNYKGAHLTEAIQDIESWFFEDIEGIYSHLRAPRSARKPEKFRPAEKYNNKDLLRLFRQFDQDYRKGYASENFLSKLDKSLIKARVKSLDQLCAALAKF